MQDSLHDLLHKWEIRPKPDPNFRAAVWGRIAAHKQRLSFRFWSRTEEVLTQPVLALAVVAALLLAGGMSGNAWREHRVEDERVAGFRAYVVAVNPIAQAAGAHP
jgi:hypothetical protein